MTGAGSGEAAFGIESSFLGSVADQDSDSNPDYYGFGRNVSVTELQLDNQLQRLRDAGEIEAANSIKQNFEGALSVEAVVSADVHGEVEDLVFNDAGAGFTVGRPTSAKVYTGVNYLDGTAERAVEGTIPTDYDLSYTEDGALTYSLTMLYADESLNTSITPSSVTTTSDGAEAAHHSLSLNIDGTTVSKLSDASLSISEIARYHRGSSGPTPVDAAIANPTTSLDVTATFSGPSRTELAYGGAGQTQPADRLSSVAGSLTITIDGTTISTYDLPKLKPDTHGWTNVVDSDDTEEEISFHVNGGVTVS